LNKKTLPKELKPSATTFIITMMAGLFFEVFAGLFIVQTAGLINLK
jgi:hypothetical protein